jgi:hypothetical protein
MFTLGSLSLTVRWNRLLGVATNGFLCVRPPLSRIQLRGPFVLPLPFIARDAHWPLVEPPTLSSEIFGGLSLVSRVADGMSLCGNYSHVLTKLAWQPECPLTATA